MSVGFFGLGGRICVVVPAGVLFGRLPRSVRIAATLRQMIELGSKATPFVLGVMLMLGALGALVASRASEVPIVADYVSASFPEMLGKAFAWQVAPMLTGVLIAGSSIVAMTGDLARMRVDQEIDSLEVIGIHPVEFLVLPRALALLLLTPALTLLALYAGLYGAWVVHSWDTGISLPAFFDGCFRGMSASLLVNALAKSLGAAWWMAVASAMCGLNADPERFETVGRSTMYGVISSVAGVILVNLLLTWKPIPL